MPDNPESQPPIEPPKFQQQDDRWATRLYTGGFYLVMVVCVSVTLTVNQGQLQRYFLWYLIFVWVILPFGLVLGRAAAAARATISEETEDEHVVPASRAEQPELTGLVSQAAVHAGLPAEIEVVLTDGRQLSVEPPTGGTRRVKIPLACLGVLSRDEFSALMAAHFCAAKLAKRPTGVSYSKGPPYLARLRFALSQDPTPLGKLFARFLAGDFTKFFVVESQLPERVWRRADAAVIQFCHPRLLARAIEAELVLFHLQPWLQGAGAGKPFPAVRMDRPGPRCCGYA